MGRNQVLDLDPSDYYNYLGTDIPLSDFSISQQVADMVGKLILDKFSQVRLYPHLK